MKDKIADELVDVVVLADQHVVNSILQLCGDVSFLPMSKISGAAFDFRCENHVIQGWHLGLFLPLENLTVSITPSR